MAVIVFIGASIRIPSLAQDKNVIATTEWIGKDCDRADVDIRIIPRGLASRRAVKVPFRKFFVALDGP